MILPTKRLGERALVSIGADVLHLLHEPKTVSRLWSDLKTLPHYVEHPSAVTYDWFVLSLDLLFLLGALRLDGGQVCRATR